MQQIWEGIVEMVTTPFVGDVDIAHIFLLIGLVLVFIFLWVLILRYIRLAGETVAEAV